jgi:hypothetical protein
LSLPSSFNFSHLLSGHLRFVQILFQPTDKASPKIRFFHNTLTTHITPWATLLPTILLNLRLTLFPYNSRGPPAPPAPSGEEQLLIRRRAAEAILNLVPRPVARVYFAVKDDIRYRVDREDEDDDDDDEREYEEMITQLEEGILDVFGNSYMNRHLAYNILELVVVRLVPELGERGVAELLAERGVVVGLKHSDTNANDDDDVEFAGSGD